jgi:hypothetical protein
MERMALSSLVRQRGVELTDLHLSEVEIADDKVSRVTETFVIDMVVLAHGRHIGTKVIINATQLVSKIIAESILEQGAEDAEVEAMNLDVQAATSTVLLPDGTIWFMDVEDGENVHWCIHNPDHLLLPGHEAAKST